MNVDLMVQEPVRWWPENGFLRSKSIKRPEVRVRERLVPDVPEFPDGFLTISGSDSVTGCQFRLWFRQAEKN